MSALDEILNKVRKAAWNSGIVKSEEIMQVLYPRAKIRFRLVDGSYIDVYVNVKRGLYYYHWQRTNGRIYRVNNHPTEGWHEHVDSEDVKRPIKPINPKEFFNIVKEKMRET